MRTFCLPFCGRACVGASTCDPVLLLRGGQRSLQVEEPGPPAHLPAVRVEEPARRLSIRDGSQSPAGARARSEWKSLRGGFQPAIWFALSVVGRVEQWKSLRGGFRSAMSRAICVLVEEPARRLLICDQSGGGPWNPVRANRRACAGAFNLR
jgi:hypothetical protein